MNVSTVLGGHQATSPKRLVMTTRYPLNHPGGVESVARSLMGYLGATDGLMVRHVAAFPGRVGAARIPLVGDLVAAVRLAASSFRKADLILIHGAEYAWGVLAVARITGQPVVVVWHGVRANESIFPVRNNARKIATQVFLWAEHCIQGIARYADHTVAVSPTVAADLRSRYDFQSELSIIPNGVETRSDARWADRSGDFVQLAGSYGSALRAIWVGTTGYKKGLDVAVAAARSARSRGLNVSLTVVGVSAESSDVNLDSTEDWLVVRGTVPPGEVDALYRCHDVMIFPTRYEACPMVVLEALAAGLPVIGSGVTKWLVEGAGEVISGDDVNAYADALQALADPDRRYRLSCAALEKARDYSWQSSVHAYLAVLDAAVKRNRTGMAME